jgi:nuclear cap-binding protein subunit 1
VYAKVLSYRLLEQPFKIPHVAAVVLYANEKNGDVTKEMLAKVNGRAQDAIEIGRWREIKLMLRFLACLQPIFEGEGIFPLLNELFDCAADLQTASQEDVRILSHCPARKIILI